MPTALPDRNILDGSTNPTTSTMKAALGALRDYLAEKIGADAGGPVVGSLNGGQLAGHRNRLTNGRFNINQRVVTGTVTLAAGAYGHDYWKAGAGGCTYTFSSVNGLTTITITAGTLLQIVRGADVATGTHILSWTGTAQGRIGAAAYSASGQTASLTGGANVTVEFGTGTLTLAQLAPGSVATPFEYRDDELQRCKLRYFKSYNQATPPGAISDDAPGTTAQAACNYISFYVPFPVTMESVPTVTVYGPQDGVAGRMKRDSTWISAGAVSITSQGCQVRALNQPVVADHFVSSHVVAIAGL